MEQSFITSVRSIDMKKKKKRRQLHNLKSNVKATEIIHYEICITEQRVCTKVSRRRITAAVTEMTAHGLLK